MDAAIQAAEGIGGRVRDRVKPAPDLARLERYVSRWADDMAPALKRAMLCKEFYDDNQLTTTERGVLKGRGQPDVVMNRIKPAINGIVGVIERGRTDPKALPKQPAKEGLANLATDVLRYIADTNRFQIIKARSLTDELIWGWTGSITEVNEEGDIEVSMIRPEELIWDSAARENDARDGRFLGIAKWQYLDDIQAEHPNAQGLDAAYRAAPVESLEDRPEMSFGWVDSKTRRMMVIEMYHREAGQWMRCKFVRGAVLDYGPSGYLDKKGRPRCPIEVVRAYVDIRNCPYGAVHSMLDAQREINMRRSKLLHELNTRQLIVQDGTVPDYEVLRKEANRPDGIIVTTVQGGVQFADRRDIASGQAELLAEAKGEIERQGPNPGVLGRDVKGQSGRAILAQQQAGLLELAPLLGAFDEYIMRVYRQMWACAQQWWDKPRYIRISDDAKAPEYLMVNEPVVGFDPMTGAPTVSVNRRIAELDVDIIVDSSPDVATIAEEQFQALTDMLPAVAQSAPQAVPALLEAIIVSSTALRPDAKKNLVEALQGAQEGPPDPMEQAAKQLQLRGAVAEVKKVESETAKNEATAEKTKIEAIDIMRQAEREDVGIDPASQDRMMRERMDARRAESTSQAGMIGR